MAAHCADCDGCCRVFEIKTDATVDRIGLDKAFGIPCKYIGPTPVGHGCTVYQDRPDVCRNYVCLWLEGERLNATLGEALRPNVSKVVLGWPWGIDKETLFVYPYPGFENNWRVPPVSTYLRSVLARGAKIVVVLGKHRIAISGDMYLIGTEEEFAEVLS